MPFRCGWTKLFANTVHSVASGAGLSYSIVALGEALLFDAVDSKQAAVA